MGNSNKKPQEYQVVRSFKPEEWVNKEKKSNYQIWENQSRNLLSDVYPLKSQIKTTDLDHYEMRYNNSQDIVKVHGLKLDNDSSLCSKSADAHVYVERIPYRLGDTSFLTTPQALSVLCSAYRGFNTISTFYGPVEPYQDLICFNQQGKTKVWLNSNLAQNKPIKQKQDNQIGNIANINTAYVNKIFDMVQNKTQGGALPQRLKNKFRQNNPKSYFEALNLVEQYAAEENILIPMTINRRDTFKSGQTALLASNQFNNSVSKVQTYVTGTQQSNIIREPNPVFRNSGPVITTQQSRYTLNTSTPQPQPLRSTIQPSNSQSYYSFGQSNQLNKNRSQNSITFKASSPIPPLPRQNNIRSNIIVNNLTPRSPQPIPAINYQTNLKNFQIIPNSPQQRYIQISQPRVSFQSPSKVAAHQTLRPVNQNIEQPSVSKLQSPNKQILNSPIRSSQQKLIQKIEVIPNENSPQKVINKQENKILTVRQQNLQNNQLQVQVQNQNIVQSQNMFVQNSQIQPIQPNLQGFNTSQSGQRQVYSNQIAYNNQAFQQRLPIQNQQVNSWPKPQPFQFPPQYFNQNNFIRQQIPQIIAQPAIRIQNQPQMTTQANQIQPQPQVQSQAQLQTTLNSQQPINKSTTNQLITQKISEIVVNNTQQKQPQITNKLQNYQQQQQQFQQQFNRDDDNGDEQNYHSEQVLQKLKQQQSQLINPNQYQNLKKQAQHQQHQSGYNSNQHENAGQQQHSQNIQQHHQQQKSEQQHNQEDEEQHNIQQIQRVNTIQINKENLQNVNQINNNIVTQQSPVRIDQQVHTQQQQKQNQSAQQAPLVVNTSGNNQQISGNTNNYQYQYQYQNQNLTSNYSYNYSHSSQTQQQDKIPEDARYQDIQTYIRNKYRTYIGVQDNSVTSNIRPSSQVSPYTGYAGYTTDNYTYTGTGTQTQNKADRVDVAQMASYVQSKYDQYNNNTHQDVQFSFRPAQKPKNKFAMAQSYQYMRVQHNTQNLRQQQSPQIKNTQLPTIQQKTQQKQDDILDVKNMQRSLDKKYSSMKSNQQLKDLDLIKNQQHEQNQFDVQKLQQNLKKFQQSRVGSGQINSTSPNNVVQTRFQTSQVSKIHSIDQRLGGNRRSSMNRDFMTKNQQTNKFSYENQSPIYQFGRKSRTSKLSKQLTDIDEKFSKYVKSGAASNNSKTILKQKEDNFGYPARQYDNDTSSRMATGHFDFDFDRDYRDRHGRFNDNDDGGCIRYNNKADFTNGVRGSKELSYEDLRKFMWS